MSIMGSFGSIFLLLALVTGTANAFVYSCNEVKYHLINSNQEFSTRYACFFQIKDITLKPNDALDHIYVQANNVSTSLTDLLAAPCIERQSDLDAWRVVADANVDLNCENELTLIFTSSPSNMLPVLDNYNIPPVKTATLDNNQDNVFVMASAGFKLQVSNCIGDGNVTAYTGAGTGEEESRFLLKSWQCSDLPNLIFSFDNVVTITVGEGVSLTLEYTLYWPYTEFFITTDDRIAVMSSGLSDNLQNLLGKTYLNDISFKTDRPMTALVTCDPCSLDNAYISWVIIFSRNNSASADKPTVSFSGEGQATVAFENYIEVQYKSLADYPADIGSRNDTFVVELTFTETPATPPTPVVEADPYCGCALSKDGLHFIGWSPKEIWLDIVFVLDTSLAMTSEDLWHAEFRIGDVHDQLSTKTDARFYSRLGLIVMSDTVEVVYDLNQNWKNIDITQIKSKGNAMINIEDGFNAALSMLENGRTPDRANARQVIFFLTDSELNGTLAAADSFKASNGVIIVQNFIQKDETRPGLYYLASPGFYLTDIRQYYSSEGTFRTLQNLCKGEGTDYDILGTQSFVQQTVSATQKKVECPTTGTTWIRLNAAGGCFRAVPEKNQFINARKNCDQLGGGLITSIHDPQKGLFVQELLSQSSPKSSYFWIGYTRTDSVDGSHWDWEDKSTSAYTNWDDHQPGKSAYSKCAYVDSSSNKWGDGNCNIAYPSVCEFAPCAVGNKNC